MWTSTQSGWWPRSSASIRWPSPRRGSQHTPASARLIRPCVLCRPRARDWPARPRPLNRERSGRTHASGSMANQPLPPTNTPGPAEEWRRAGSRRAVGTGPPRTRSLGGKISPSPMSITATNATGMRGTEIQANRSRAPVLISALRAASVPLSSEQRFRPSRAAVITPTRTVRPASGKPEGPETATAGATALPTTRV